MAARSYLSIGEVLVSLKTEYPDITISKIRFLEGEGLIEPERTPSGYRKFYSDDVDRLRRILKMQRDEYLPLKVIKERLIREGRDARPATGVEEQPDDDELVEPPTGLQMTLDEMAIATGVDKDRINELQTFGILTPSTLNGEASFDGDDYVVLSIVKDFFKFGVEARHLTMYRHFAEREAALFEAIILPMLRQRNPDARRAATDSLLNLARAAKKLKQALLRTKLRQYMQVT
jgi:DNA-binding transcriptional MerR regulator